MVKLETDAELVAGRRWLRPGGSCAKRHRRLAGSKDRFRRYVTVRWKRHRAKDAEAAGSEISGQCFDGLAGAFRIEPYGDQAVHSNHLTTFVFHGTPLRVEHLL